MGQLSEENPWGEVERPRCKYRVRLKDESGGTVGWRPCRSSPMIGKEYCRGHRKLALKRGRPLTTSKKSKAFRLFEHIEGPVGDALTKALLNPNPLSMTEHLASIDALLSVMWPKLRDMVEEADWQRAVRDWERQEELFVKSQAATREGDNKRAIQHLNEAIEHAARARERSVSGARIMGDLADFMGMLEQRRRVTSTEVARGLAEGSMVPVSQVIAVVYGMFRAVRERVSSLQEQHDVILDVCRLAGVPLKQPREPLPDHLIEAQYTVLEDEEGPSEG